MREGENMICPVCGEKSMAKCRMVTSDNWMSKKKILVCAFCNAELSCCENEQNTASSGIDVKSKLAALLGDDVEQHSDIKIKVEQGDEKVCRNCKYLAVHPFKNVCLLTQLEVDTMDDCDKFELRIKK